MQSLFRYSHLKIPFASYLLPRRNNCEIMLAMCYEYEVAKCRSELFNLIEEKSVTNHSKTRKKKAI